MIRSRHEHSRWRTSLPLDVLVTGTLALFVGLQPTANAGVLHVLVGLVVALFVPGYVLLAALFPAHSHSDTDTEPFSSTGLGWGERAALSVGTSVALLPMIALVMAVVGASFTASSMRAWVVGTVLVVGVVAVARRYTLPPEQRLVVPLTAWFGSMYDETAGASNRRDAALNVALAVSVLLALASVGFAVADTNQSDPYAGVALLTENESGDLVAADHPTSYERGETHSYIAQVQNHRQEPRTYTLVTELQRLRSTDDGSTVVVESETVSRQSLDIAANANGTADVSVTPSLVGEDLRLVTFLYEGDAPDDPSMDSASEHVFLWVDVSPDDEEAASTLDDDAGADSADDTDSVDDADSADDTDSADDADSAGDADEEDGADEDDTDESDESSADEEDGTDTGGGDAGDEGDDEEDDADDEDNDADDDDDTDDEAEDDGSSTATANSTTTNEATLNDTTTSETMNGTVTTEANLISTSTMEL